MAIVEEFFVGQRDALTIVALPNRVDVSNTRSFVDILQRELDSEHWLLIFDFEQTQAIDSTALGAMVQVFKTLRTQGGHLSLCNVGSGVRRVLAITRVDRVFPIYDDLDAAVLATGRHPNPSGNQ